MTLYVFTVMNAYYFKYIFYSNYLVWQLYWLDVANTMVRAFLTKIGESYLNHSFNTGSGKGKEIWQGIKIKFESKCAFCGKEFNDLTIEHLVMFNRKECGLHHPGNVVPSCKSCNKRTRDKDSKEYVDWIKHLETKCDSSEEFKIRKEKIIYI